MLTIIQTLIRVAAAISLAAIVGMLVGWQRFDITPLSIYLIMIAIWASSEWELYSKRKKIG